LLTVGSRSTRPLESALLPLDAALNGGDHTPAKIDRKRCRHARRPPSPAFQTFVKQHTGSLRQVLTPQEYNMLKAIAADLRRSNRSLTAIKIPGQSNTALDALPELKKAMMPGSGSLLAQLAVAGGGGYGVHGVTGALTGIAGVLAKNVIGRMHEAGMEKVGDKRCWIRSSRASCYQKPRPSRTPVPQ
jgi:hypothetical protein